MKIAIADDHALVREGLAAVLMQIESVTEVVEAGTFDELENVLSTKQDIDLILLDLNMPGMNDVHSLNELQDGYPTSAIAILSATETSTVAKRFLDSGAAGYIPKSANNNILLGAIQIILSGGVYVPSFALNTDDSHSQSLTERQFDVLALMVEGLSNKGIARRLDLTESTVKTHLSAILKFFGVDNRMKAIREAIRQGIIEIP